MILPLEMVALTTSRIYLKSYLIYITIINNNRRNHFMINLYESMGPDWDRTQDPGVASSIPVRSHTFVEIDHKMISTVILLPSTDSFIQEGLLSVTSESMCTNYWLTACSSLPRKKCGKVN